ncbi:MAG: leucine-rich repeat domain-containing protein, partial [Clostridia bacterium]|nr:leucine-rich repeat domain-containing protein [Clostridia bacterium]
MKKAFKKSLAVIMVVVMVLTAALLGGFVGLETSAYYDETYTSGYYTYGVEDGGAIIVGCDSAISGDVVVPTMLGGYPVTGIESRVFEWCSEMTSIHLPAQVGEDFWYYGAYAPFQYCTKLERITVAEGNTEYYSDENGVLFSREFNAVVQYPIANDSTSYTVPEGITYIGCQAFSNNAYLESVTIPDSVLKIRNNAFENCANLETVTLGKGISEIEYDTFSNCKKLTGINIPFGVNAIGSGAFQYCESLTKITIPESVSIIDDWAFGGCTALAEISLPDKIIAMFVSSFSGTEYFNNTDNWSDGALYIGNHLIIANLGEAKEYTVKDGTLTISYGAFYYCTALEDVTIPDSVSYIGAIAFDNTALYADSGNWTNNALYIDKHLIAVKNVSGKYTVKAGTLTIADIAFLRCNNLTSVSIPDTVRSIGNNAFYECEKLESVNIPASLKYLGYQAFYYCRAMKCNIKIPTGIEYIGRDCFVGCSYINSVTFEETNGQHVGLGTAALGFFASINAMSLPEGITHIPKNAFCYGGMEYIILPDSVEYIGVGTTDTCENLKFVHIPHTVKVVDSQYFNENTYICAEQDSEYLRAVAAEHGIEFRICNGHGDLEP